MPRPKFQWSWSVFLRQFCISFCGLLAVFVLAFLVLTLFADTSSASFGTAMTGLAFAVLCSAVYGTSRGEEAVRDWRNAQSDHQSSGRQGHLGQ